MLDVHVVTHTHWDREWYLPLERFRQRLVALVDELIDDPPAGDESFLLDGQAIVVADYLEVRPDRADALRALLRDGRIEAGPWYVLADELIPSGEALVRNLLAGRRALKALDATIPPVLYCPDSFGHPAALPTIAAGFGFPLILLWRGYGSARGPSSDTAVWVAPNGDRTLLFHLPRDGYEFGSHLPSGADEAQARWSRMRAELAPRSATGVLLVQNGADHHARQRNFRDAIGALVHAGAEDHVHASSLTKFADAFARAAAGRALPAVRGELRDSYGYTWSLQGTFAARAHEKRLNAIAERHLIREAEPWAALAAMRETTDAVQQRRLLEEAWRTLLAAHPHDTLCGCSIDDVARAMEVRVRSATNQATGIRDDAVAALLGHDPVAAREAREHWQPVVIVRNAAPRVRSGVAVVEVEEFVADVAVGPGSAPKFDSRVELGARRKPPRVPGLGKLQMLSREFVNRRTESPRHYPDNDLIALTRTAAWVVDAPAYGVTAHAISDANARSQAPDRVAVDGRSMHNAHLSVSIDDSGHVRLEHRTSGRVVPSLVELLDELDVGDLYTPAPRPRPHRVEFRGARVVHRGPLRGAMDAAYRIIDAAGRGRRIDVDVRIRFTLDAQSPFVRVSVAGENRREDHRVRLRLRSDLLGGAVWADAAFGPVRRDPIIVSEDEARMEAPPATAPLHRYVSRFDAERGVTVFSDGLAEYEAPEDGSVVITLLRAVGELSRNDIAERPGHAGWPAATPLAQCLGPFAGELAVMLHGGRDAEVVTAIEHAADDVLNPLVGTTLRSALRVPEPVAGFELQGDGLALSTIKPSEDGEALVLRCVNLLDVAVDGRWCLPFLAREAHLARLDETQIQQLEIHGGEVAFRAAPRGIVTIRVR